MFPVIGAVAARLGLRGASQAGSKGATQAAGKTAQRGAFGKFAHSTFGNTMLWTVGVTAAMGLLGKMFGGGDKAGGQGPDGQKAPPPHPTPAGLNVLA